MNPRTHYTKPSITDLEVSYATDAAANGWGERCYDYIHQFESRFRDHLDVKHAIATSSCTGALHMGMAGLGIGAGDEVILADINWIASVAPVSHLRATPVFVDVQPSTWCIDPQQVEDKITTKTKAIVAVHLYGNLCDMDALLDISRRHGIPLIEDAAEAVGSMHNQRRAGSMGTFGTFSFHGTKTLTTGEGGMFVTNDDELYETVLTLSNHGRSRAQKKQFWPDMIGFKYKMSNVQAAIGCAQMERVEALVARKREILHGYKRLLKDLPELEMNPEPEHVVHGAWMPTVVFPEGADFCREQLLKDFASHNIDARVFFHPLSELPFFEGGGDQPVAKSLSRRGINLPSFFDIREEQMEAVASVIHQHWPQTELIP